MKNLLIGNGINIEFNKGAFCPEAIRKRFIIALTESNAFYKSYFYSDFVDSDCILEKLFPPRCGIEELADILFNCIKDQCIKSGMKDSINLDKRIISAIKMSALTAIFFDANMSIAVKIPGEKIRKIQEFDHVYSLNYHEFWDHDGSCTYLHGSIPNSIFKKIIAQDKPILFYDKARFDCAKSSTDDIEAKKYFNAVNNAYQGKYLQPLDESSILFSPTFFDKISINANFPSERNFPAWDNFCAAYINPYTVFVDICELCVFGVSPYGDKKLIDSLKGIRNLTIFIHNLNSPSGDCEKDEWNKLLERTDVKYFDSKNFWL